MYCDPYADKYQKFQGFEISIIDTYNIIRKGFLSFENSTRSTYDIAMRDATIDGLVTMDDIENLKPSQIFYKNIMPNELFIIQSVNKSEQQLLSKNINAIKQNSFATILRKKYDEEIEDETYKEIYKDIISFVSIQNKDEKNFAAGIEDNTILNIQIPKRNIIKNTLYEIKNEDKLVLTDINKEMQKEIKIESIDAFGVPGIIRIYGTFDTRTGDKYEFKI